ncbi:uncharacterized protein LOC126736529 isoform X2 [Anthonomus grandis grandis]|uniref:uncharacterized protein LOC126736529 isoform X2 n=1 Tax=Anthonomus grandis grandis TaxID=2921223 RepID=UPI002166A444|nr:uncharacterized protein LOC126736529 isoform X2 [Anthonomus grandis grandis]
MSGRIDRRSNPNGDLVIDNVLTSQPELGPSIPDGGYGWIVFVCTLFFHLLIPSLLVSFGIFVAFSRYAASIQNLSSRQSLVPELWDDNVLHVPLFFVASWTLFDPASRKFISQSIWPKLFATAGTCLTCAGLLFFWMGRTGYHPSWIYILSGTVSGIGSSIQMAQCEILLAQYFKLKLAILTHLSHAVSALGFILAPVVLAHHILAQSETQVLLWYQAIILQGLILNLLLRKPMYLKSKSVSRYNYVTTTPDDEEDIFSKSSRELQIKTENGNELERHEVPQNEDGNVDSPTETITGEKVAKEVTKKWVSFEEDEEGETTKYERVNGHESSNGDIRSVPTVTDPKKNWEKFEDDPENPQEPRNHKNLHLEMSFGNINEPTSSINHERPSTRTINGFPIPLFSDMPVNNNTTYSYDMLDTNEEPRSSVFMPTTVSSNHVSAFSRTSLELLQTPTFYKSLFTVITTKWSLFVFFALYPTFLFEEVEEVRLRHLCNLVGTISLATLIFTGASFWINIEKRWRPKVIWFLSWIGALGYFMISDYFTEGLLIFGAVQIVLSIAALQHIATPLLGLTVKGEATTEYTLICILTGLSFGLFSCIHVPIKTVFRLMAVLKFFTGCLWLGNYIYKRLR